MGFASHELRNISHNLVLLFAFSVLENVLKQLRDEGAFTERRNVLGKLMDASCSVIPWSNYNLVNDARKERNRIAHQQQIIERGKCWDYVDAIEAELVTWEILSVPIPFNH